MKVLIIGDRRRYERYNPEEGFWRQADIVYCSRGTSEEEILTAGRDAELLFVDAIAPVSAELIRHMPHLKMIHSEGVGYDRIHVEEASRRGIPVCNNKGCNAGAVAEQAVFLMLALLRSATEGQVAVLTGQQIQMKERRMREGIRELAECKVGLVGFGDIAKETALRLKAFGCECFYYSRHRKSVEEEEFYSVRYLPLEQLAAHSDIVSLHAAVNEESRGMIGKEFLENMQSTSFLVNTARGDLVDNMALREALLLDQIAGYGLDTIYPEPVSAENPLVCLPAPWSRKVVLAPHLGGITSGTFRRAYRSMWENAARVSRGERPEHVVNPEIYDGM
ncbi:MAG: NAD(P)-dependent oxidoreductase [Clostridiales bacterium]|nr:NAD(P)-dependent oxidoreductase [Clostridiales bacterium]